MRNRFNYLEKPVEAVRRACTCSSPNGIIVALEDNEEISLKDKVYFVPEGKKEHCELPIAAFEEAGRILEELAEIDATTAKNTPAYLAEMRLMGLISAAA